MPRLPVRRRGLARHGEPPRLAAGNASGPAKPLARRLFGGITLVALALAATAAAAVDGPYKDVSQHADAAAPRITMRAADGSVLLLPEVKAHGRTLIWAFATGECGAERWGPFESRRFAESNVPAFVAAGVDYIVSTGGEAGIFTCASDAGMQRFVALYDSPRLAGLDFDIEGKQTPEQIDSLVQRAKALALQRPGLRLSFTLATHGSGDGSRRSLNPTGEAVLASIKRHRLDSAIINLMVMNYGPADTRWCVLRDGGSPPACDMGRSALQAAHNVQTKYGVPYAQIALTAMPGENDVAGNVTSLADAALINRGARDLQLAGVHWWSLDRDRPCAAGSPRVSPHCHALPGVAAGAFGAAFIKP